MPELSVFQWIVGVLCAYTIGVAKTGFPGLGILGTPLMILVAGGARQSAGWLLPILLIGDIFAVCYWRRHASPRRLFALAPWILVGMAGGAAALSLSEKVLRPMIGVIVFLMLVAYLYRRWRADKAAAHSATYGITAGFATTVANAAGPVMSLYLLSMRLPNNEFIATGAWFFLSVNFAKIAIYSYHGLFSPTSLAFDAVVAPVVIAGAMTGKWLVLKTSPRVFEASVVILTAIATALLFR